MTRLWLCIFVLGGTVAFLSCGSDNGIDGLGDGGGPMGGSGGRGGASGSTGSGGSGTTGVAGFASDGTGPVGGRGGCGQTGVYCDGHDPINDRGGSGGHTDGSGPVGGRGGDGGRGGVAGSATDGSGPVAGRGGTGGCPFTFCDGAGPVGGRGGSGALGPCDGLGYFQQRGWCAPTYAEQVAKQVVGNCDYVRVFTGICDGQQIWTTRYSSLGDPVVCAYDGTGNLAGARICTDTTMPAWNCNGAAQSPNCLNGGAAVPSNVQSCTGLTTTCPGGCSGGLACDGAGPVGGRGGA